MVGRSMMPGRLLILCRRAFRRIRMAMLAPLFRKCGRNVRFDPGGIYSFDNIEIGSDVFIGPGALLSSERLIRIGDKVMFGPGVMILGGDHNTSVIGSYMRDVREKRPGDDLEVIIEDDVWIGARVTILKGVTIGRGAVVGAGSLVNRSVPRYSVVVGSPARVVRYRFDPEAIEEHERRLGLSRPDGRSEGDPAPTRPDQPD